MRAILASSPVPISAGLRPIVVVGRVRAKSQKPLDRSGEERP